jgi:glycosyltransferase involved in cell wall biosynthesis
VATRRVLMTGDTFGGAWTYALELAAALRPYRIEVVLATMGEPPTSAQHAEARAIENLTVYPSRFRLEWMRDPWRDVLQAGRWLLALERLFEPWAVHLNSFALGVLPFTAPKIVVAHTCLLSWWKALTSEPVPAGFSEYKVRAKKGLQCADRVVVPGRSVLRSLVEHYGPIERAVVIEHAVSARRVWAGVKGPMIFTHGHAGDRAKNITVLDGARRDLRWPVYVAGNADHGVRDLISLGQLSRAETAAWLSTAAIYASPARYDAFGISVVEAAISRCALVLADIPSFRERWNDAAVFVKPDDPAGFRAALRWLIADGDSRGRLAAKAAARAAEAPTEEMGAAYAGVYADAAEERSAKSSAQ